MSDKSIVIGLLLKMPVLNFTPNQTGGPHSLLEIGF